MIGKQELYALLGARGIACEICEHAPVYTIGEMDALHLPQGERVVKNLFLRDDKKRNYYLVTAPGNRPVDLRLLGERIPSRKLSFAGEDDLRRLLGLEKGHVTPFGALNDEDRRVVVVFDEALLGRIIGVHPMENTATVFLSQSDVAALIAEHQNRVIYCNLEP